MTTVRIIGLELGRIELISSNLVMNLPHFLVMCFLTNGVTDGENDVLENSGTQQPPC